MCVFFSFLDNGLIRKNSSRDVEKYKKKYSKQC